MASGTSKKRASSTEVLIVGAGVAGLTCARALADRGVRSVVLDRARGVGGRCATWRGPHDLPLDYGVTFLHGDDDEFLSAVARMRGATLVPGWPARIEGNGTPCQSTAFAPRERRYGVAEGISAWTKHLASGLDVRLEQRVESLKNTKGGLEIVANGAKLSASKVVLALACEQARDLLESWSRRPAAVDGALNVLSMVGTVPSLTLMAVYESAAATPSWDILYPEDSDVLQLVSQETRKRPGWPSLGLVLQARPTWSRDRLEQQDETWAKELLAEASRLIGSWAAKPSWTRAHRWRFARTDLSSELAGPMLIKLSSGRRLGLAGELFARGAGVEAAWLSGRELARMLVAEEA